MSVSAKGLSHIQTQQVKSNSTQSTPTTPGKTITCAPEDESPTKSQDSKHRSSYNESASNSPSSSQRPLFSFSVPKNGTGLVMQLPGPEHKLYIPTIPEPISPPSTSLIARMVLHDAQRVSNPHVLLNRVVYDCIDPSPMHSFAQQYNQWGGLTRTRANSLSNRFDSRNPGQLIPYYIPLSNDDTTLVFESRFESGNLRRAIQVYEYEYDLILKFDVNTRGHTQWFYFSVRNAKPNVKYKFNLINLLKPDSLYNYGMKPLVYSEKEAAKENGKGWFRGGEDICYYQNNIKRKSGYFYTLTFSYTFENENDVYYFAYCYPYTYTDLQHYLSNLEADPVRRQLFRRRTLCQTLAGNNVDVLTVTSFTQGDPEVIKARKGVVVTARVHPGESNSSFMMKGIIDYLTGPSVDAKILRDNFVFKIVPMLNPDGVINGNYRCSLAGVDLNRRWIDPSIKLHPTIYHTKEMIRRFYKDREVVIYCDLHGHSRKKNIFMYGCPKSGISSQPGINSAFNNCKLSTRIFPRILWKISQNFSYQDCSFGISRQKESTGRVVIFREVGIQNSYTMEASFCGPSFGKFNNQHFNTKHLEQMGHFFCEAIIDYCDPDQTRVRQIVRELELLYPENELGNGETDSMGSDDEESEGSDATGGSKGRGRKSKKKKSKSKSKASSTKAKSASTKPSTAPSVSSRDSGISRNIDSSAPSRPTLQVVTDVRPSKSRPRRDSVTSLTSASTPLSANSKEPSFKKKKSEGKLKKKSSSSELIPRPSTAGSQSRSRKKVKKSSQKSTDIDIDSDSDNNGGVTVNIQIHTGGNSGERVRQEKRDRMIRDLIHNHIKREEAYSNYSNNSNVSAPNDYMTSYQYKPTRNPTNKLQPNNRQALTPSVYRTDVALSLGSAFRGNDDTSDIDSNDSLPRLRGRARSSLTKFRRPSLNSPASIPSKMIFEDDFYVGGSSRSSR